MEMFQTKLEERLKHKIYAQDFSPENRAVYGKMWEKKTW
jgi:hypothetical protein